MSETAKPAVPWRKYRALRQELETFQSSLEHKSYEHAILQEMLARSEHRVAELEAEITRLRKGPNVARWSAASASGSARMPRRGGGGAPMCDLPRIVDCPHCGVSGPAAGHTVTIHQSGTPGYDDPRTVYVCPCCYTLALVEFGRVRRPTPNEHWRSVCDPEWKPARDLLEATARANVDRFLKRGGPRNGPSDRLD